jgi:methylthioribulose 1-phosphate dehydratase / enolase-phosphatase E1
MVAEDMYVFSADGKVLSEPAAKPWPDKPPKCTDCAPLFMKVCQFPLLSNFCCCFYFFFNLKPLVSFFVLKVYQMRGAGAVIHSHGIETCIASMLDPGAKEFRVNPLVQDSFRVTTYLSVVQKTLFDFADLNADDSYGNA